MAVPKTPFEFTLDTVRRSVVPRMEFYSDSINTSIMTITLTENYGPVNLAYTTVEIIYDKQDKTQVINTNIEATPYVEVIDTTNGIVKITLTTQALSCEGRVKAQIKVWDGENVSIFPEFTFNAKKGLDDADATVSSNEFPLLQDLVNGYATAQRGLAHYDWTYTAPSDNIASFTIASSEFNPAKDQVDIYDRNVLLYPNIDYTRTGSLVVLKEYTLKNGSIIFCRIIKDVIKTQIKSDGALLEDGSVAKIKLSQDVQNSINDIGDLTNNGITENTLAEAIKNDRSSIADIMYSVKGKTTAQIQQAINSGYLLFTFYFPNTDTNIYTFDNTLVLPSHTKIVVSDGVTLKLGNTVNKPMFINSDTVNGNSNISIIGGKIDMNVVNQSVKTAAMKFTKVANSIFDGIEFLGTKSGAYTGEGCFDLNYCDGNIIKNITLHDSGDEGLYIKNGNHNIVEGGSYFNNNNGSGVACDGGSFNEFHNIHAYGCTGSNMSINSPRSLVMGCIIENGIGNNGLTLGHAGLPADYTTVTGNKLLNNRDGIRILGSSTGIIVEANEISNSTAYASNTGIGITDSSHDCIISNNYVHDCVLGITTSGASNIVTGNKVKHNSDNGIYLTGCTNSIVQGNISENNLYGIYIMADSSLNIIDNNKCFDSQTTKTQLRGIYSEGSLNKITSNFLTGNKTTQMTPSVNDIVANNLLSDTDKVSFDVTLPLASTTLTITNANLRPDSSINIMGKSSNVSDRKIYISNLNYNTMTLTFLTAVSDSTIMVAIA